MGFRLEGFTQTTEVQGGTRLVRVNQWHAFALPSETFFQFRRPSTTSKATVHSVADQLSTRIEAVLDIPAVTDVVYAQDVTPGGQLRDMMTTFYESKNGNISGSVESDLAHFGPTFTGKQVAAEIAAGGDFLT